MVSTAILPNTTLDSTGCPYVRKNEATHPPHSNAYIERNQMWKYFNIEKGEIKKNEKFRINKILDEY